MNPDNQNTVCLRLVIQLQDNDDNTHDTEQVKPRKSNTTPTLEETIDAAETLWQRAKKKVMKNDPKWQKLADQTHSKFIQGLKKRKDFRHERQVKTAYSEKFDYKGVQYRFDLDVNGGLDWLFAR